MGDHGLLVPVVTFFRNAITRIVRAVPQDYWELQPKPVEHAAARKLTPIALKPIVVASDMVLHRHMLAKSVHGKADVEAAVPGWRMNTVRSEPQFTEAG